MTEQEHKPFCLTASLLTPMVLKKSSVNLAGLLYHACLMHTSKPEAATSLLNSLLKMTDGIHHASNMTFGVQLSSPLIGLELNIVGRMSQEKDFNKRLISPNGVNGKYKRVQTEGGVYKTRLDALKSHHCELIHFYGAGDATQVKNLLNHYVSAIGSFANRGTGSISDFTVEFIKEDKSLIRYQADGSPELMRKLPVNFEAIPNLSNLYEQAEASLIPPFYSGTHQLVMAYIPNKIILTRHK